MYRCETLNTALNGKPNSQHKLCNALDFNVFGQSLSDTYKAIQKSQLVWDQLLLEGRAGHQWIHISYNTSKCLNDQRKEALTLPNA